MTIKVDFSHTQNAIKVLKDFDSILGVVGEQTKLHLLKLWEKAKDGYGRQAPVLSDNYKKYKIKQGKGDKRDLFLTGKMQESFKVKNKSAFVKAVGFTRPQENKASGNYDKVPTMFQVGNDFKTKMNKFAEKLFWRGVNK
jgi:hypothetical protein